MEQAAEFVGQFLLLLLVGMPSAFQKNELVFACRRHVVIDIFQKTGRVTVGEVVIGADDQCASWLDTLVNPVMIAPTPPLANSS